MHLFTLRSLGSVSFIKTARKTTLREDRVRAKRAGTTYIAPPPATPSATEAAASPLACTEKYAPMRGPRRKPTEKATPIAA